MMIGCIAYVVGVVAYLTFIQVMVLRAPESTGGESGMDKFDWRMLGAMTVIVWPAMLPIFVVHRFSKFAAGRIVARSERIETDEKRILQERVRLLEARLVEASTDRSEDEASRRASTPMRDYRIPEV